MQRFSLLGAASSWCLQGPGWNLPIPPPVLVPPSTPTPFLSFIMLYGFNSVREITIKPFTKLPFSLGLPLRLWTFTIHSFSKYNRMAEFPGIAPLRTPAPQNGINTFENNATMSYKTRGKREGRRLALQGLGRNDGDFFQGTTCFCGSLADKLTMAYSFSIFLPFPLIIHTSGTQRGDLFSF